MFFCWLRVQTHLNAVVLHSRYQYDFALDQLGFSPNQLALLPYQVDPDFWRPMPAIEERLVASAGLEHRDYPTLVRGGRRPGRGAGGGGGQPLVEAEEHGARREPPGQRRRSPATTTISCGICSPGRRSIAVPVDDVDFQAGITTILEAMAMGKPVIVTHTYGQTDVIEDRRSVTRGAEERARPVSLLRDVAEEADVPIEPNGFYVPPKDPAALQRAIDVPAGQSGASGRLGAAGRRAVERLMTVDQFAERIARVIELVARAPAGGKPAPSAAVVSSPAQAPRVSRSPAPPPAGTESPTGFRCDGRCQRLPAG